MNNYLDVCARWKAAAISALVVKKKEGGDSDDESRGHSDRGVDARVGRGSRGDLQQPDGDGVLLDP